MDYDLDLEWAETAHPLKLYRKMDTAEDEWPEWEFEAIVDWLGPIEGADMEIVGNVMGALQVLLFRPDRFWGEWEVFENCIHAFNGNIPHFGSVQPPSPGELLWGVHVARDLTDGEPEYEVVSYTQACLFTAGISIGIDPIDQIEVFSSNPSHRTAVRKRVNEVIKLHDGGDEDITWEETDVDIESARLLAAYIYKNELIQLGT